MVLSEYRKGILLLLLLLLLLGQNFPHPTPNKTSKTKADKTGHPDKNQTISLKPDNNAENRQLEKPCNKTNKNRKKDRQYETYFIFLIFFLIDQSE